MSIAFVTGSAATGTGGTVTVTAPASIVSGNFLLALVGSSGAATGSGWTAIGSPSTSPRCTLLYKWATGTEPGSYTFAGTSFMAAAVLQYSGVDPTTPVDFSAFAVNNGPAPGPMTLPGGTTTASGDMLVTGVFDNYGDAASTPSGLTARATASGASSIHTWEVTQASPGAVGPWSTTMSGAPGAFNSGAATVALLATPTSTPATATGALTLTGTVTVTIPAAASGVLTLAGTATGTPMFTLSAIVSGPNVNLSWTAVGASYAIERDGQIIAFGVTATTWTDTPGSGEHTYRVGVLA